MQATKIPKAKKNLLLCFDAFGTLFTPSLPIPVAYARAASRHGIDCGDTENPQVVGSRFKQAFKDESKRNPNYGRATGLGAEKWWGNVINQTFQEFVKPDQEVPSALILELLKRYSSKEGYDLCPDVQGFFNKLQHYKKTARAGRAPWPYDKTVVGVITNSDDRIPGILRSFGLKVGTQRSGSSSPSSTRTPSNYDIDFVTLSYDVGHEKPDRRIFDAVDQMLVETAASKGKGFNVNDFDKLYVGDDLEKDYAGALAAGWYAVLLDRTGIMQSVEKFRFGQVGMEDKKGKERKVLMARSLNDLELWSSKKTLEPSNV